MPEAVFGSDEHQEWINEVQQIVCDFVANDDDDDLGELMLDHSERYWDDSFGEGLTPQQALDRFISHMQQTNALAHYKAFKVRVEADSWWIGKMRNCLVELSKIDDKDITSREHRKAELELLIVEIVARYRATAERPA
jgi:uncharacterized UBP type Zn finger protein